MSEGIEGLEQERPFEERLVAHAGDDFQTERLLPLADSHMTEDRYVGHFGPEIGEGGAAEEPEVELHEIVHVVGDGSLGGESRPTKARAVLKVPIERRDRRRIGQRRFVLSVLTEPERVGLKEAVDGDRRVLRFGGCHGRCCSRSRLHGHQTRFGKVSRRWREVFRVGPLHAVVRIVGRGR